MATASARRVPLARAGNRLKLEKRRAEEEEAERRRLPIKREEQLLSYERLQSTLMGGSSNAMRFA